MNKLTKMMKNQREALEVKVQELKQVKGKKGFTLIELIVVMAILAILVLLAAPRFLGYTKDAAASSIQQDAKVLSDAAFQYNIDTEVWPTVVDAEGTPAAEYNVTIGTEDQVKAVELSDFLKEKGYVKSTSEAASDYVLIIEGDREGDVLNKKGTPNKDGQIVYGSTVVEDGNAETTEDAVVIEVAAP